MAVMQVFPQGQDTEAVVQRGHLPCGTGFVGMKWPWAAADKRPQLKAESPPHWGHGSGAVRSTPNVS